MNINYFHGLVELGLTDFRTIVYDDISPVDLDAAANAALVSVISSYINHTDNNTLFEKQALRIIEALSKEVCQKPVKQKDGTYAIDIATDYLDIINYRAKGISPFSCTQKATTIKENHIYRANGDVKYDNKWYTNCDTFTGNTVSDVYGDVSEIQESDLVLFYLDANAYGNSSNLTLNNPTGNKAVVHRVGNKILIEVDKKITVTQFCYTYISKTESFSSCDNKIPPLSDDLLTYLAEKTVQYIAIRHEQGQQKIVNLKQETLQ